MTTYEQSQALTTYEKSQAPLAPTEQNAAETLLKYKLKLIVDEALHIVYPFIERDLPINSAAAADFVPRQRHFVAGKTHKIVTDLVNNSAAKAKAAMDEVYFIERDKRIPNFIPDQDPFLFSRHPLGVAGAQNFPESYVDPWTVELRNAMLADELKVKEDEFFLNRIIGNAEEERRVIRGRRLSGWRSLIPEGVANAMNIRIYERDDNPVDVLERLRKEKPYSPMEDLMKEANEIVAADLQRRSWNKLLERNTKKVLDDVFIYENTLKQIKEKLKQDQVELLENLSTDVKIQVSEAVNIASIFLVENSVEIPMDTLENVFSDAAMKAVDIQVSKEDSKQKLNYLIPDSLLKYSDAAAMGRAASAALSSAAAAARAVAIAENKMENRDPEDDEKIRERAAAKIDARARLVRAAADRGRERAEAAEMAAEDRRARAVEDAERAEAAEMAAEVAEMAAEDRRARAVEDAEKAVAFTQTFIRLPNKSTPERRKRLSEREAAEVAEMAAEDRRARAVEDAEARVLAQAEERRRRRSRERRRSMERRKERSRSRSRERRPRLPNRSPEKRRRRRYY